MTLESLKDVAQSELVVKALQAPPLGPRTWGWANEYIAAHLPAGTRVLLDANVVPIQHRDLSLDAPAQVVVTILDWDSYNVMLELADGTWFWFLTDRFLDAVFADKARDAP